MYKQYNNTYYYNYVLCKSCNLESDDDPTTTVADTGMGEGSGILIIIIVCNPMST